MSPSTDNFIHSLVEMSKAFEELPKVQASLERMQQAAIIDGNTIAEREATILRLKAEIDDLHTKIRDVEVAKDAAETMFLEADDRTSRALDFIKATFGNAGALIQALEPPRAELAVKEEPKAESKPAEEECYYASANPAIDPFHQPVPEVTLIPDPIVPLSEAAESPPAKHYGVPDWMQPQPEVVPEPSPTDQRVLGESDAPSTEGTSASSPVGQATDHVLSEVSATGQSAAPNTEHGPYVGKCYVWEHYYISLADWLAGGGTEPNYYYRP